MSRTRIAIFAAVLLALGIAAWLSLSGKPAATGKGRGASTAIVVDSATTTRRDVPIYLDGLGSVQAFNTVTVTARVDGQLQKIAFVEGQTVKKGDLLAQLDPRPAQAALDQARAVKAKDAAQLANAKLDYERYMVLAPQDLTSKQTVDTQRALVDQLTAQLQIDQAVIDNATTQLAYTTITAPVSGRTGIRLIDAGNIVHASDTTGIVVVTQVQPITVILTMPEDVLPAINAALGAGSVAVAALSRDGTVELDHGSVSLIDNQIDRSTGTVRVKAIFPNAHNTLWPGQFVDVRLLARTEHRALTLPTAAIERGPNGLFAYVIKPDDTVEVRPLTLGDESGPWTVVEDGLQAGEQVVTSNQYRLQAGTHVRISTSGPGGSGGPSGPSGHAGPGGRAGTTGRPTAPVPRGST